jgi:hypothetical protein
VEVVAVQALLERLVVVDLTVAQEQLTIPLLEALLVLTHL